MVESWSFKGQEPEPERNSDLRQRVQREFETLKEELETSGYALGQIRDINNPTKLFMMRNDLDKWARKFEKENGGSQLGFEFVSGYKEEINGRLVELGK